MWNRRKREGGEICWKLRQILRKNWNWRTEGPRCRNRQTKKERKIRKSSNNLLKNSQFLSLSSMKTILQRKRNKITSQSTIIAQSVKYKNLNLLAPKFGPLSKRKEIIEKEIIIKWKGLLKREKDKHRKEEHKKDR